MELEINTLIIGADPTPRIVAIELGETGTVKVYRRERDGSTIADVEPFHPFVWADSDVVDLGIETEKLQSDLKKAGRAFFAFNDPVQHYLTATGRTLFKELALEELKRMQLEVLSFSDGENDRIMSIALSDHTGWEELIVVDPKNPAE